jgi:pimeloyl-ACP methyl ester carboxylesterase
MPTPLPIYLLPGLGADHRLYQPLIDLGLPVIPVDFILPEGHESLQEYARRMAAHITTLHGAPLPGSPHIIGGVSLGGIIATEVARITQPEHLVLISTVIRSREVPPYFKMFRYMPLHRVISADFLRKYAPRERYHGMNPSYRKILDDMRAEADPVFLRWAMNAVVTWRQPAPPAHYLRLHGTYDLMFPGIMLGARERLPKAGHTMVMTHAPQVAEWMRRVLPSLS